jgi:hypothetical protein
VTAKVNSQGELVLQLSDQDKLQLQSGDVLIARRSKSGDLVLKRSRPKRSTVKVKQNYLTPGPLAPSVLKRLYSKKNQPWEKLEEEAVLSSRTALKGHQLNEL